MRHWVIAFGATRHICADKDAFVSYSLVGNEEELVYLRDSQTTKVLGRGKILLKFILSKIQPLNNVLHVSNILTNIISMSLLRKVRVKASFEYDKVVLTKNNVFIGKGYCN